MYGIYTNIGGILMVNVTLYSIHGSYGVVFCFVVIASFFLPQILEFMVPNFVLLGEIEIGDLSFLR